jgi:hypothetical protein
MMLNYIKLGWIARNSGSFEREAEAVDKGQESRKYNK